MYYFHLNGNIPAVDGNMLTLQFDKAGEKRVVNSFVERVKGPPHHHLNEWRAQVANDS